MPRSAPAVSKLFIRIVGGIAAALVRYGAVDSSGDTGIVTTNPAADGSGTYTLGPTNNVGTTGNLFRPIATGIVPANGTTDQTMSITAVLGLFPAALLDQPPLANMFINGVLDIPLAQIVATGNIAIPNPANTFIAVNNNEYNVVGGNPNIDPVHIWILPRIRSRCLSPRPSRWPRAVHAFGQLLPRGGCNDEQQGFPEMFISILILFIVFIGVFILVTKHGPVAGSARRSWAIARSSSGPAGHSAGVSPICAEHSSHVSSALFVLWFASLWDRVAARLPRPVSKVAFVATTRSALLEDCRRELRRNIVPIASCSLLAIAWLCVAVRQCARRSIVCKRGSPSRARRESRSGWALICRAGIRRTTACNTATSATMAPAEPIWAAARSTPVGSTTLPFTARLRRAPASSALRSPMPISASARSRAQTSVRPICPARTWATRRSPARNFSDANVTVKFSLFEPDQRTALRHGQLSESKSHGHRSRGQ